MSSQYNIPSVYQLLEAILPLVPIAVVVVPALIVILAVLYKLCNKNNLLVVNLLISDLLFIAAPIVLYLAGMDVEFNCSLLITMLFVFTMANRLMFLPMAVNTFVIVAFPYSHKRIMTNYRLFIVAMIVVLWLFTAFLGVVIVLDSLLFYIGCLYICRTKCSVSVSVSSNSASTHHNCWCLHHLPAPQDYPVKQVYPWCHEELGRGTEGSQAREISGISAGATKVNINGAHCGWN